jgi:hypothetical protein
MNVKKTAAHEGLIDTEKNTQPINATSAAEGTVPSIPPSDMPTSIAVMGAGLTR